MKTADSILYSILRLIKRIIAIIPLKSDLAAGVILGRIGYYFLPERRKITIDNISRAFPDNDLKWCRVTARRVYENFGKNMMELIKFSAGKLFSRVKVSKLEKFDSGAVLLTGHIGNWELTGMSITASGRELYPVGRRIHNKAFDRIVDDLRTVYGSHHIPYRGSIREIMRKIKENKNICILMDQRMRSGLPLSFFGRPVWCTRIASVLWRKTKVDIVPGYSYHSKGDIQVVYDEPLEFIDSGDALKSDFINTQKQLDWLEEKIRQKPDEWFWMHNFWKDKWPAVFFDRDGTINVDRGYVSTKEKLEFLPGVFEAMREIRKAGYLIVIITNQSGIARGYYTEADYMRLNTYFMQKMKEEGVIIDRVYHCPHHPDEDCSFRKPNPGMIFKARDELNIDLAESFVIGDKVTDIKAAENAGTKSIMVMTGYGREHLKNASPDHTAEGLKEAVPIILKQRQADIA
ncbi:MAG: D-glycero-beta-D-manno-heptose 1,7-bisphosphate 7-phosphatase [Elusimicrobiota bacterium]